MVGPSGGGKSTVVNLVERFYDPSKGQVLLDGVPLPDIEHEHLHTQVRRSATAGCRESANLTIKTTIRVAPSLQAYGGLVRQQSVTIMGHAALQSGLPHHADVDCV